MMEDTVCPVRLRVGQKLPKVVKDCVVKCVKEGRKVADIQKAVKLRHSVSISRQTINQLKKNAAGCKRKGRPRKILPVHLKVIDLWQQQSPEMTARELQRRLLEQFNISVSRWYVSKLRTELGWQCRRVKYCQLITNKNKKVRVEWCCGAWEAEEKFEDVVFTDETSVEMSQNGRIFFYRPTSDLDKLPAKASKPKHAYKVHMWGGISMRGRTDCCIFTGIMDSVIYQQILEKNLLPWASSKYPEGFRLYQDNDSKHVSKSTKKWMEDVGILDKVMPTPASSPDLNPIENVWSTMKDHLQRVVKPRTKAQLVDGILGWWRSLTAAQCARYIQHIHRVIPQVIVNKGGPTVF